MDSLGETPDSGEQGKGRGGPGGGREEQDPERKVTKQGGAILQDGQQRFRSTVGDIGAGQVEPAELLGAAGALELEEVSHDARPSVPQRRLGLRVGACGWVWVGGCHDGHLIVLWRRLGLRLLERTQPFNPV